MKNFADTFHRVFQPTVSGARLRLAPTPSGYLHLGNGINFVLNWLAARAMNGQLMLRIDDLDADRKRPEYVQDIFDTLRWLGLEWQEGPQNLEEFEAKWSNRHRMEQYHRILADLANVQGVFACAKSRKDLEAYQGIYPPEFRNQGLALDQPDAAWRALTPPGFPFPDFIVRRRDGIPAYQVASLADDLLFGITHIIRGEDLQPSTAAQQWLAATLSPCPARAMEYDHFLKINFLHHPLILDESGGKLSKSAGAMALKTLREKNIGPERVFVEAAKLLGLPNGISTAEALYLAYRHTYQTHLSCNFIAFSSTSRTQPPPPGRGEI